ncbi:MAG TPA: chemotaxis protein CheW [Rhodopila sp.]|jgi:purine-binding chemotaxis protein CheW|nr:chemotaxis protein CheW [Rhodopila sp.]
MHFSATIGSPRNGVHGGADSWLLCRTGSFLCALRLTDVIEIMPLLPTETIAGAPPFVLGLAIIRGSPTLVVDIGQLLGGRGPSPRRQVTIKVGTRIVALAVDSVAGVRSMEIADTATALPPLLREAANDAVSAIGRHDADLLLFLDTARIVPESLFETIGAAVG